MVSVKGFAQLTVAATLAIAHAANVHQHLHRHVKKELGSKVERRSPDVVTETVVVTQIDYEFRTQDGKPLDPAEAAALNRPAVPEAQPSIVPTPLPPAPKAAAPSSVQAGRKDSSQGAQFVEKPKVPPSQTSKATQVIAQSSSSSPPPVKSAPAPSLPNGGNGLNAPFPDNQVDCSSFPEQYGAMKLDYLPFGGYSGLQQVQQNFVLFESSSVSHIVTTDAGQNCTAGTMCSYACPPGYQKSQWPAAQGSTGQSVGGLFCNANGKLQLTRPEVKTLCIPGAGGVSVKNDLDEIVSTCRTDYPGTEAMVIPAIAKPGETVQITNPVMNEYYQYLGKPTSAQWYINPKGLGPDQACIWKSKNSQLAQSVGNWAPVVLGVGADGDNTWISLFLNKPTSQAPLDFNVEITGDVSSKCSYSKGSWSASDNGCTVSNDN